MPNNLPNANPLSYLGVRAEVPPNMIKAQMAPTANDRLEVGTLWSDEVTGAIYGLSRYVAGVPDWEILGGSSSDVNTLTGNTGGALSPTGGNINVIGSGTTTVTGAGSTLTISATAAGYPITPYVVGPVGKAGYQTIQAAITAANAAGGGLVFIQPGTYTENLTLFTNISLASCAPLSTTIVGVHTPPAAGNVNFQFLILQSATDIFNSAAAGTTKIELNECDVRVTNGFCFNLLNWTGTLEVFSSTSVLGTNDGFLNNTGGATVFVINSDVGFGTANPAVMTGVTSEFISSSLNCPATLGGAGSALFTESCEVTRTFTSAGTATVIAQHTVFEPIGAVTAAIDHGSAGTMSLENCTIKTNNNPSITGAGAGVLTLAGCSFTGNSLLAGTLTTAAGVIRGGNFVSQYVVGTSPDAKYQTVQAAITAANAAGGGEVIIKAGTYVENLTLFNNVSLNGIDANNTTITGVHTPPAAGSVYIENLRLTSATDIFNSAAAGTTRITLFNCDVRVTNGFCFNLLNWTVAGELDVFTSTSVLGTNDGFVNNTGGTRVFVTNSDVGFGTANPSVMTGVTAEFISSSLNCPATVAGAGSALFTEGCEVFRTFTTAGTATVVAQNTVFEPIGGVTAAISHGSAGVMSLETSTIKTANDPAIAGAGAGVITLVGVDFTGNANIAGTLTTAAGISRGGNFVSQYVVGASPDARYQTVQAAITAANAAGGGMVFIKPGTYTENLTLFSGVSLVGSDPLTTIITGVHTPPAAGNVYISTLTLTSATDIFNSAAAGTTRITLFNCDVRVTNGFCFNLLNWTVAGELDVFNSTSVLGTNDGFLNNTGGVRTFVINSDVGFGAANPAVMTAVVAEFVSSSLNCPATIGGAGTALFTESCEVNRTFTTAGTATLTAQFTVFQTGATPAITHGSAGVATLQNCVINSSNNPAITGAGAGAITIGEVTWMSNNVMAGTLTIDDSVSLISASQITTSAFASGLVWRGSTFTGDGSDADIGMTVTPKGAGTLTVTTGNIQATNGNLVLNTAGNKLNIAVGANASCGTSAALGGGTGVLVVATTAVTANSVILLTTNTIAGVAGVLSAPQALIVAGTSFTIQSSNAADTSTVNWLIIN